LRVDRHIIRPRWEVATLWVVNLSLGGDTSAQDPGADA